MRVLTLSRLALTPKTATWRCLPLHADSSVQVNESIPVDSSVESRGEAMVDVEEGHRPSKQSLRVETTDQSGSNAHTDRRDQEISPPDGARFGDEPMEDPIQGSCQATRKIQDPSLAKGSQTSLPRKEGITKQTAVESGRPDPLLMACALIATELSKSCFETPYGKIGELLYRGDEVNPNSQNG